MQAHKKLKDRATPVPESASQRPAPIRPARVSDRSANSHRMGAMGAMGDLWGLGARLGAKTDDPCPYSNMEATDPEQGWLNEYGIPQKPEGWQQQRQIDGGKLEQLWAQVLADHNRSASDELSDTEKRQLSGELIQRYTALANETPNARFFLDLLPTDTENVSTDMIGTPNSFSSIPELMGARNTSVSLAQGRTENSFGLAIPYANNIANVLDRSGDPTDGADNLNAVLALLNPEVETIGNGYSQGGAAVLSAVARPKGGRALDQAIALAPMGGCNRQGGKGLWAGKVGETSVVCATHSEDPAADITPGGGNWEMAKKAYSFEERPLDRALHSDTCEWQGQKSGLCDAAPDTQGTHGYPEPLVEQAVQLSETSDERNPQAYQRIQDWEWDQRELTHTPDLGLGPKPGT